MGSPCKEPRGFPDFLCSSASSAFSKSFFLSKYSQALISFSNFSILSIYCVQTSTEEIWPVFKCSTNLLVVRENMFIILNYLVCK